ncbi:recombinase family protein [Pseudomonas asiatica]|uniref:recombinase family protein n=1 Tax=Pseudomonas asiatica TaxID=2219225 RepID=UPI003DA8C9C3
MLIGYARVSKADGSQSLDLQHDALRAAGVERDNIYDDLASGGRDDRPGLTACLKSLRDGDVLVVWKLDRLGRSLAHLVNTVKELSDRKIGLRVLTGKGAQIDTTTASGRMVFGIFATLAEFEGTVAKLAMRQPFVLFKGLTFQKLCLPGAFRPGDHHNKMLRPGLCVVHASPQYL